MTRQMTKEEAIQVLEAEKKFLFHGSLSDKYYEPAFDIAIEALQTDLVRCKDCKHRQTDECLMRYEEWYEIDEGDGYADTDFIIHDYTRDDGFCHHGEREEL